MPKASPWGEAVLPGSHLAGCCGASVGNTDIPSVFHAAAGHHPIPLIQHAQTPFLLLVTKGQKNPHVCTCGSFKCVNGEEKIRIVLAVCHNLLSIWMPLKKSIPDSPCCRFGGAGSAKDGGLVLISKMPFEPTHVGPAMCLV